MKENKKYITGNDGKSRKNTLTIGNHRRKSLLSKSAKYHAIPISCFHAPSRSSVTKIPAAGEQVDEPPNFVGVNERPSEVERTELRYPTDAYRLFSPFSAASRPGGSSFFKIFRDHILERVSFVFLNWGLRHFRNLMEWLVFFFRMWFAFVFYRCTIGSHDFKFLNLELVLIKT